MPSCHCKFTDKLQRAHPFCTYTAMKWTQLGVQSIELCLLESVEFGVHAVEVCFLQSKFGVHIVKVCFL